MRPPGGRNVRCRAARRCVGRPPFGTCRSATATTAASPRRATAAIGRCRYCRQIGDDVRAVSRLDCLVDCPWHRPRLPGAVPDTPAPARRARGGTGHPAQPRSPWRRHRAAPVSGRPARARLHRRPRRKRSGTAAMRASNWRSRRKFWPRDLRARRSYRAITSRSGSSPEFTRERGGRRTERPRRIAAAIARDRPGLARKSNAVRDRGGADNRRPSVSSRPPRNAAPSTGSRLVVVHAQRASYFARHWCGTWCRRVGASDAQPSATSAAIAGSMISISSRRASRLRRRAGSGGDGEPRVLDSEIALEPRSAARPRDSIRAVVSSAAATPAAGVWSRELCATSAGEHHRATWSQRRRSARQRIRFGPGGRNRSRKAAPWTPGR